MNKKRTLLISVTISVFLVGYMTFAFINAMNFQSNSIVVPQNKAVLVTPKGNIELELAQTPEQQMYGLMNRTSLELNKGMIFMFSNEEPRSFWMKDTLISLDMIFLNKDFKVVKIHKSTLPNQTEQTYYSEQSSQYVIELNGGATNTFLIQEGDTLKIKF